MKTTIFALLLLSATTATMRAGWCAELDRASIWYSPKQDVGRASFDEAVKELAEANRIEALTSISGLIYQEEFFQKELLAVLERDAPRELQAALKSSGNIHNPKVGALPFQKAVLATPTVRAMSSELAAYGFEISVGIEQLSIVKEKDGPRFCGVLELHVKPSKAPGKPPQPPP